MLGRLRRRPRPKVVTAQIVDLGGAPPLLAGARRGGAIILLKTPEIVRRAIQFDENIIKKNKILFRPSAGILF